MLASIDIGATLTGFKYWSSDWSPPPRESNYPAATISRRTQSSRWVNPDRPAHWIQSICQPCHHSPRSTSSTPGASAICGPTLEKRISTNLSLPRSTVSILVMGYGAALDASLHQIRSRQFWFTCFGGMILALAQRDRGRVRSGRDPLLTMLIW